MASFIQIVRIASISLCTAYLEAHDFPTLPDNKSAQIKEASRKQFPTAAE
jgi:hypothetical protein